MRAVHFPRLAGRWGRAGIVLIALLAAVACQTISLSQMSPFDSAAAPQPCPNAAALADAVSITEFGRGSGQDDGNVLYSARILRTQFACDDTTDQIRGRLTLAGTLTLGRRGTPGDFSLPIFIALTQGDEVVSKRFESVEVAVERGATSADFEKTIYDYAFSLAGQSSSLAYEILAGFNLTPEQVAYNRGRPGG